MEGGKLCGVETRSESAGGGLSDFPEGGAQGRQSRRDVMLLEGTAAPSIAPHSATSEEYI